MTIDVNYIDLFQFLNWSYTHFSASLSKFGVFMRNWPACSENVSFLYAGSYCMSKIESSGLSDIVGMNHFQIVTTLTFFHLKNDEQKR